ncbi:hypothetical protein GQ54DRAFT_8003 [Martensiomyces pterosporus]|nr:hypothetical protein GQ54DRAFT_8003 [Martensiomyces pterosporus]
MATRTSLPCSHRRGRTERAGRAGPCPGLRAAATSGPLARACSQNRCCLAHGLGAGRGLPARVFSLSFYLFRGTKGEGEVYGVFAAAFLSAPCFLL